jgi:hypothetical protein
MGDVPVLVALAGRGGRWKFLLPIGEEARADSDPVYQFPVEILITLAPWMR